MKCAVRASLMGGVVLVAGTLFPPDAAFAFGQQWRPAPGHQALAARPYQAAANLPAFRPAPGLSRAQRQATRYAPRYRETGRWQRPPVSVSSPRFAGLPPRPAYPAWGHPYGGMDPRAWQAPLPMYAPHYAWRPPVQPWAVPAPHDRARHVPQRPVPSTVARHARDPRYAGTMTGGWRPAARQVPVAGPRYGFRPVPHHQRSHAMVPAVAPQSWSAPRHPVAVAATVPVSDARWRPQPGAQRTAWHPRVAFRPVGYGRSISERTETAPARGGDTTSSRDELPGWVTTYEDTADSLACSWCSGS